MRTSVLDLGDWHQNKALAASRDAARLDAAELRATYEAKLGELKAELVGAKSQPMRAQWP